MKKSQKRVTALLTIVAVTATAHLMQRNGAQAGWTNARPAALQAGSVLTVSVGEANSMPETEAQLSAGPVVSDADSSDAGVETATAPLPTDFDSETLATSLASTSGDRSDGRDANPDRVLFAAVTDDEKTAPGAVLLSPPDMPRPPADAVAPAPLPKTGAELAARMAVTSMPATETATASQRPKRNEFGLTCGVILSASERPGGMVNLMLTAPCRAGEVITVRHGGLAFAGRLSQLGGFTALVPALADEAEFTVSFPDGETSATHLTVPSATTIERVVLQTEGETGLQIHALEFVADYHTPGDVCAGQPRDAAQALKYGGGFITQLGDPSLEGGRMAEVYTFPADPRRRDGVVRLSIETEVTAYNCGKDIAGETIQRQADGKMNSVTVTLAVPDCDAIGEFLVLKNLLQDLKIASN